MTIKSLTITEDAYDSLKAVKCGDESFSEVIIRLSSEKVGAAAKFFGALKGTNVKALEQRIKKRRAVMQKEFEERAKRFRMIK